MLTQRRWRAAGLISLGVCGVLAWYGAGAGVLNQSWPVQGAYWGTFLLALLLTIYMVLLDLRYTRMQFARGEKQLFEETLGSEEFRRALRKARETETENAPGHSRDRG